MAPPPTSAKPGLPKGDARRLSVESFGIPRVLVIASSVSWRSSGMGFPAEVTYRVSRRGSGYPVGVCRSRTICVRSARVIAPLCRAIALPTIGFVVLSVEAFAVVGVTARGELQAATWRR
jgi:hypothetical protein